MNTLTYVVGGRLGDFIHVLWVVKRNWEITGKKGVIIMSHTKGGDRFTRGLQSTYEELKDVVEAQSYVEKLTLEDDKNSEHIINLNKWRNTKFLFKTDWITMLSKTYELDIIDRGPWMETSVSLQNEWRDTVAIHQSTGRIDPSFPWDSIIQKNKCVFVTCSEIEYEKFAHKDKVPCKIVNDLKEMIQIIGSAKAFCGNQSSPLAIAVALGKSCYCQLYGKDAASYIGIGPHVCRPYTQVLPEHPINL